MANTKTKREYFEEIKNYLMDNAEDAGEYVDFLEAEIEKYDAKAEREKAKRAEKKAEGDALKDAIKDILAGADEPITAGALTALVAEDFPEATKAKVVYRVNALVKEGLAEKEIIKIDKAKAVAYKLA